MSTRRSRRGLMSPGEARSPVPASAGTALPDSRTPAHRSGARRLLQEVGHALARARAPVEPVPDALRIDAELLLVGGRLGVVEPHALDAAAARRPAPIGHLDPVIGSLVRAVTRQAYANHAVFLEIGPENPLPGPGE